MIKKVRNLMKILLILLKINNPPKKKDKFTFIANPPKSNEENKKERDRTAIKDNNDNNISYNINEKYTYNINKINYDKDDDKICKTEDRLSNQKEKENSKEQKNPEKSETEEKSNKNDKTKISSIFSSFWEIALSNNTLAFSLKPDENNFFIKYSVFLFTFNLYILFNIIFMTTNSSLHLFKDRDKYLHESLSGKIFVGINILLPLIVYLCSLGIRRLISVKEFLQKKNNEFLDLVAKYPPHKKTISPQDILKLHALHTDISKFKNRSRTITIFFAGIGFFFLLFVWYLTACFCGIYENSLDCLIINIIISIIFAFILTQIMFFISSLLMNLCKSKTGSDFSKYLNPTILLYGEIKTNPNKEKNK